MAKAKSARARHTWPNDPVFESYQAILTRMGRPLLSFRTEMGGDPAANFVELATTNISDLNGFAIGNGEHLKQVAMMPETVAGLIRDLAAVAEQGPTRNMRAEVAAANLLVAAQMILSAVVMYMRASAWYVKPTLTLLRPAIELTARAEFIAQGTKDEASRFSKRSTLKTPQERRAVEFNAADCIGALHTLLRSARPGIDDPKVVYHWLCSYTHFDSDSVLATGNHETSYGTLAYVAWANAVVAERILGIRGIATWPQAWPTKLPWK